MKARRSLAAAQTVPRKGDVDANLEEHLRLARAADDAGARLLLFPELSLTGYQLDLAGELAFPPETGGLPSGGCGAIWSESGERLVRLDATGPGVALATDSGAGWEVRVPMLGPPA